MVLLAAALLPAVVLMTYIYRKDKVEREPIGLVMRVFVLGALSGLVAAFVEGFLIDGLEAVAPEGLLRLVVEYFVCVAAVEEACKYACLNSVKNHPAFDHLFDAVVYSVAAALGFAALENVFYVFDGGLETALLRAVLSVPGHAADGVVMGVFYGMARQRELHGDVRTARSYYWLAFLLPAIEHGFYDAALSTESDLMALVAMVFDLAFIALAFFLVNRASATDEPLHPRLVRPSGGTSAGPAVGAGPAAGAGAGPVAGPDPYPGPAAGASFGVGANPVAGPGSGAGPVADAGFGSASSSNAYSRGPASAQPYAPMVGVPAEVGERSGSSSSAPTSWFCPNCGARNQANFCPNCGTPNPLGR